MPGGGYNFLLEGDNLHSLKLLCDEIFGEKAFIECIVWNKRVPKNDKGISNIHEYILLYARSSDFRYKFMVRKEGLEKVERLIRDCKKEAFVCGGNRKAAQKVLQKGTV